MQTMYQRGGEVGFMEKITCSRGGQSDTRMTDGAFVQKPNTARSLNYLRAANWRMSLRKG